MDWQAWSKDQRVQLAVDALVISTSIGVAIGWAIVIVRLSIRLVP